MFFNLTNLSGNPLFPYVPLNRMLDNVQRAGYVSPHTAWFWVQKLPAKCNENIWLKVTANCL